MSEITARISTLPTPPTREDPDNFDSRADSFLAALPTFQSEANQVASQINDVLPTIDQANETSEDLITSLAGTALSGTSTTSLTVATGSKSLTTQTGKEWVPGHRVKIVYQNDYTIYMIGDVTSYNSSTGALTVNVSYVQGSGTYASWSIFTIPDVFRKTVEAGEDLSANDPVSINSEDSKLYKFRHYSSAFNGSMPETISNSQGQVSADKLDSTHVVVAYADSSSNGKVVIGTISDKQITWGTAVTFNAASTNYISVVALTSTSFVVVYRDEGNSNYGTAIAGTVSGTTITLGSETTFWTTDYASYTDVCRLDDTHFFVGFQGNDGANLYPRSVVGSVSGTTITFGTVVTVNTGSGGAYIRVATLDSTHVVVQDDGAPNGTLRVAEITLSTNSISYPTANTSVTSRYAIAALDSSHFVSFDSTITGYLYSVSGTTITQEDSATITTDIATGPPEAFKIDSSRIGLLFSANSTSKEGFAVVECTASEIQSTDEEVNTFMTPGNSKVGVMLDSTTYLHMTPVQYQIHDIGLVFAAFVGLVSEAVTSGNQSNVYYGGRLTGFSNLVPGRLYKLDGNGVLKLSSRSPETDYRVGIATSSTTILIQL